MPPRPRGEGGVDYISNEPKRKLAFRKRKKSIYKKADELSKLCDIDVCLIVYEGDEKKGRPIQPETWPQDPNEFKRMLDKYKNSKDIQAPGLKRNFDMSDFCDAMKNDPNVDAKKNDANVDAKNDANVDAKLPKSHNYIISAENCPAWDDRINDFSKEELVKLVNTLGAKIQASTKKIDSIERKNRLVAKQNHNVSKAESSKSKPPHPMYLKHTNQVSIHQTSGELGAFNKNSIDTTTSAMELMPSHVRLPMLPSAWISSSEKEDKMTTSSGSNPNC